MAVQKEIEIPLLMTKYHGTFDLAAVLKATKTWLESNNLDFAEPKYKHKMGDTGAEIEVEWAADRKRNYYVKENIEVYMLFKDVKDVEVTKDGKKTTLQQGRVLIDVKGKLDLDWQGTFAGKKWKEEMHEVIQRYILKKTINIKWADDLYNKVYNFNKYIRNQLGMETP